MDTKVSRNIENIEITVVDSLFLINKTSLPLYSDYHHKKQLYLTRSINDEFIFIHNKEGIIINTINLPSEGPGAENQMIDAIFDEWENEVVILSLQGIKRYSLEGMFKHKCNFESLGQFFAGYSIPRIISLKETYIMALLSLDELDFDIGSKTFLREAAPIKVINKNDCSCTKKIPYPSNSPYFSGIFQNIFYEPMISIDTENNELEVFYFSVEDKIYQYDLNSFNLKQSIDLAIPNSIFPKPLEWHQTNALQSNFNKDFDNKTLILTLMNFNGKTLVSYKENKSKRLSEGDIFYNIIMDNNGNRLGSFHFNENSLYDFIIAPKDNNSFFAFPDFERFEEEPIGYPIKIVNLE